MHVEILERLNAAKQEKRPCALATDLQTGAQTLVMEDELDARDDLDESLREAVRGALVADKARILEHEEGRIFIQPFNGPLRLVIVGAVHIAQALAPMGALAGYAVTVIDPRRGFASEERFPGVAMVDEWPDDALEALQPDRRTAIVTLTHDPKLDDPALDAALRSNAFYIAALGSKRTHASRLERLTALGHDRAALARIHGPAGLSIGAVSPAEIAIAILGEMTAALRRLPEASK